MRLWPRRSNVETVRRYVDAINARDYEAISRLLAEGVRLVDASGEELQGRDACVALIREVYRRDPDYALAIERFGRRGEDVYMMGKTLGTDQRLIQHTQFRARADHEVIHEWQFYGAPVRSLDYLLRQPRSAEAPGTSEAPVVSG